jgi:tetratricopeptide (TPR) repeat protein
VLRELIREIQRKPPGVRDSLIAFAISAPAGSLGWLAVSKISRSFHKDLSDAASSAIGFGIVALVLLVWLFREPIRRAAGTYKPKGDRLAIYVAQFEGDNNSRVLQQRIESTVRADFGETIDVIYCQLPPLPPYSENADTEAAEVSARARVLLAESGGDILIWGKLLDVRQEACPVHFILPGDEVSTSNSFRFRGEKLEAAFSAGLGTALASRAMAYADAAREVAEGEHAADALAAIARLSPLVDRMPECILSFDRSRLLRAFGLIHYPIRFQSGESAPLDVAIKSFKTALTFLKRNDHPLDWARLHADLGSSLKYLGWWQVGVGKLKEAAAVLRQALEVPDFTRSPRECAWAECDLSEALGELGRREGKAGTIREGIAAANRALDMLDPKVDPEMWARAQGALGMGFLELAALDEETEHCQTAIAAFECELTQRASLGSRLGGIAKLNMAIAYLGWGRMGGLPEKIRTAVNESRAALAVLKPFPVEWARAQINLGDALTDLSRWEEPEERLKEAIVAYELALSTELRRRWNADLWAKGQFNCGLALSRLGELQKDLMAFQRAETALRQALTVWTSGRQHDQAIEVLAHVHRCLKDRLDRGAL